MPVNDQFTVITSGARTTGATSGQKNNKVARGCFLVVDVTAASATPSITDIEIQGLFNASWVTIHKWSNLTSITAVGTYTFMVYPGASEQSQLTEPPIDGFLPYTYRVKTTHLDSDSMTYSVVVTHLQ